MAPPRLLHLPDDYPGRPDPASFESPMAAAGSLEDFVQRDAAGAWRVIRVNGLGHVVLLSEPLQDRAIIEQRFARGDQHWWSDARARRRGDRRFGARRYDGVDWWDR